MRVDNVDTPNQPADYWYGRAVSDAVAGEYSIVQFGAGSNVGTRLEWGAIRVMASGQGGFQLAIGSVTGSVPVSAPVPFGSIAYQAIGALSITSIADAPAPNLFLPQGAALGETILLSGWPVAFNNGASVLIYGSDPNSSVTVDLWWREYQGQMIYTRPPRLTP